MECSALPTFWKINPKNDLINPPIIDHIFMIYKSTNPLIQRRQERKETSSGNKCDCFHTGHNHFYFRSIQTLHQFSEILQNAGENNRKSKLGHNLSVRALEQWRSRKSGTLWAQSSSVLSGQERDNCRGCRKSEVLLGNATVCNLNQSVTKPQHTKIWAPFYLWFIYLAYINVYKKDRAHVPFPYKSHVSTG